MRVVEIIPKEEMRGVVYLNTIEQQSTGSSMHNRMTQNMVKQNWIGQNREGSDRRGHYVRTGQNPE